MKKKNIQFHATIEDIYDFILSFYDNRYTICGVAFSPNFEIEYLSKELINIKKYHCIVISKKEIHTAKNNYEFMKMQDNNLIIEIGKIDNEMIKESAISVFSETEIDTEWKKIISTFKKSMLRGAWVVNPNPNGGKVYYKNHLYTENAKNAYENGIKICPICGWNVYELSDE